VRVLYFAWLRERAGTAEEIVAPPPEVRSVAQLIAWMAARPAPSAAAFTEPGLLRCAVNQVFAGPGQALAPEDEVAFFPPVTGG
jgi:molybdopterin synthase sulfur carrier subunit